jgi:hypothetical protein
MKASSKVAIRPSLTRTLFMTNLTQAKTHEDFMDSGHEWFN